MRAALGITVLSSVLGLASFAEAQQAQNEPTPAQVRTAAEAFDQGREAYKKEEYVEAAEQFEKADDNAPSSAAIELAIRARDKAGELDRAASLAALALKRHPSEASLQKVAPDILRRASLELFQLTANCDTPCDLTVGGKIVHGGADTQRSFFVAPGKLTVRAGWSDGRSESKQIEGEKGGAGELSFSAPEEPEPEAAAEPAPEPAPPEPSEIADSGVAVKSSGWSPLVFWVGVGATAVAGGVTIWSGVDTQNNPGPTRVREECVGQGESCPLYQEGLDKQLRTNVLLGVTAGLGLATILVGAVATDWSGGAKKEPEASKSIQRGSVSLTPWVSLEAGGLSASGRF
jgi:hypothetical protein